jgi:metal-responsive CopG/Arc/MetJ family transcriptional regulator
MHEQLEYGYLVRRKISITLPEELLKSIDRAGRNRSAFIERACRAYLVRLEKPKQQANDIEIINAHANLLNEEAMDVLEYQGLP